MRTYRIELPPFPRNVSANFRGSTKQKAADVAQLRRWALMLLKQAKIPKAPGLVLLEYEYFHGPNSAEYYQPQDDDNLVICMKPCRDSLAAAKIVIDDSDKHVQISKVLFSSERLKVPKTIMTVHLLDPGEEIRPADESLYFTCRLCKESYFIAKESTVERVCTYCVIELGSRAARKQLRIPE